jgi:hypothetical protein
MTDHELLETFDQRLHAYVAEHPDGTEGPLMAYGALLQAATPGLTEALGRRAILDAITAALTADRGDGLPVSGPTATDDEDGDIQWTSIDQWTLADFRLNLAWWHRRPGAPAARLAALIAYGEQRWPGEALSRPPWPATDHLPPWGPILVAEARMADEEEADEADEAQEERGQ